MNAVSKAQVLPTQTPEQYAAAVQRAVELLRAGEVVALPTETVYGLAANALQAPAVARIYEIKGRPAHNPIIVHVASLEMACACVAQWPGTARRLAASFWPGPLTMVLPRAAGIPDIVTAGGPTVGVRWPSHPFIQAVIQACGFPLAAPSANLSNRISPTSAAHVAQQLGGKIPLIVDGGASQVGIESTVVDLSGKGFQVLRPGMIHEESLSAALGEAHARSADPGNAPLRSPGLLAKHYSPKARLVVLPWPDQAGLLQQIQGLGIAPAHTWVIAHERIPTSAPFQGVSVLPHEAAAYARALYAEWHRCDERQPQLIVVEQPPAAAAWKGIRDRLARAAAPV